MNIHYFQHVPFEGPGFIENWAHDKKFSLQATRFFRNDPLPDLNAVDWLVVMGGPMSVHDEQAYPWLKEEKQFIRQAIEKGKMVIGICLGAQLIAEILGAKVYPNKYKEIGWWPVQTTSEARKHPLFHVLPPAFTPFHWHGDMFDLPEKAIHLIESPGCLNQAFSYKENVIGIQFHFELTSQLLDAMLKHGKEELQPSDYVQPEEHIRMKDHLIAENNRLLGLILDEILNCQNR